MFDTRTIVIEPNIFGRCAFGEEQHIGFHTLRVEDAGWQTQDSVQIEVLQQLFTNRLSGIAFKQHIIRQHDSCTTAILQ